MQNFEGKLVVGNTLARTVCDLCGELSEKRFVTAEVAGLNICEHCLKNRDFDLKLEARAGELEAKAKELRALKGKIDAPTYDDFQAAENRIDDMISK